MKSKKPARRKPAANVATAARLQLLGEIARGRVRWIIGPCQALLIPPGRAPVDVTRLLQEVLRLRPRVALIDPWDPDNAPPYTTVSVTPEGEDRLIRAAAPRAPRKRAVKKAPVKKTLWWKW